MLFYRLSCDMPSLFEDVSNASLEQDTATFRSMLAAITSLSPMISFESSDPVPSEIETVHDTLSKCTEATPTDREGAKEVVYADQLDLERGNLANLPDALTPADSVAEKHAAESGRNIANHLIRDEESDKDVSLQPASRNFYLSGKESAVHTCESIDESEDEEVTHKNDEDEENAEWLEIESFNVIIFNRCTCLLHVTVVVRCSCQVNLYIVGQYML